MLRNCKDEIRVPLLKRRLLKGALCLGAGLLSPPYGTGGGGGGVGVERVVAHNPQPPQKRQWYNYGLIYHLYKPQVIYPRRRRIRIWSCPTHYGSIRLFSCGIIPRLFSPLRKPTSA